MRFASSAASTCPHWLLSDALGSISACADLAAAQARLAEPQLGRTQEDKVA